MYYIRPKRTLKWYSIKLTITATFIVLTLFYYSYKYPRQTHDTQTQVSDRVSIERNHVSVYRRGIDHYYSLGDEHHSFVPTEDGDITSLCQYVNEYKLDRCEYSKRECSSPYGGGLLPLIKWRFCGGHWVPSWLYYILCFILLIYLFYLLGELADVDFCPSLTQMSNYLKLSEDIAGVTLLAIGNGAPDIATIFVSLTAAGSAGLGVGEPLGAGVTITTLVFACCILFAPGGLHVPPFQFLRDVIFYLFAVILVIATILNDNTITIIESILYLFLYFLFVFGVVMGRIILNRSKRGLRKKHGDEDVKNTNVDKKKAKGKKKRFGMFMLKFSERIDPDNLGEVKKSKKYGGKNAGEDYSSKFSYMEYNDIQKTLVDEEKKENKDENKDEKVEKEKDITIEFEPKNDVKQNGINQSEEKTPLLKPKEAEGESSTKKKISTLFSKIGTSKSKTQTSDVKEVPWDRNEFGKILIEDHFKPDTIQEVVFEDMLLKQKSIGYKIYHYLIRVPFQFLAKELHWNDKNIPEKIVFILNLPVNLLRLISIPSADPGEWSKLFACLSVFFFPTFVLLLLTFDPIYRIRGVPLLPFLLVIGFLFFIAVLFSSRRVGIPIYHPVLVFVSFVMSIIWIYFVANEVVNVLETLGMFFMVSESIIGVTVLSWGNSIGDLFADVAMVRSQKKFKTALAAVFCGPALNLLIGLGISVTASCIIEGKTSYVMGETIDLKLVVTMIVLFISLLFSLIVIPITKFKVSKFYGVLLLGIYVLFLLLNVLVELEVIFPNLR